MALRVALEAVLGRAQQALLFCGCRMFFPGRMGPHHNEVT